MEEVVVVLKVLSRNYFCGNECNDETLQSRSLTFVPGFETVTHPDPN